MNRTMQYNKMCSVSNYIPDIKQEDLKFITVVDNRIINKLFLFVYPSPESNDRMNIDYIGMELELNYMEMSLWGPNAYYNTSEQFDLSVETPQEAQKRIFEERKKAKISKQLLEMVYGDVAINESGKTWLNKYVSPNNIIGNDSYEVDKENIYLTSSMNFFGLLGIDKSVSNIPFIQFLDQDHPFKWVNNI